MHGEWVQHDTSFPGKCVCDAGWRHAGLSDPENFVKGRCSQYVCKSNMDCSREFPGATCDVLGWNCNCGWQHAISFLGGRETKNAKCMGILFFVSDHICTTTLRLMGWMWKPIIVLMAISVFFGEKQVRCECYNQKRFKMARSLWMGCKSCAYGDGQSRVLCDGGCVHRSRWDTSKDWAYEYSWSIYFFDLGLWAYAFLVVFFLTGLVAGSILALSVFIVALIVAAFFALIMCIFGGEGGGDIGGEACSCPGLCDGAGDCPCCEGCCTEVGTTGYSHFYGPDFLLWGPQPAGTSCDDCCTCRCCSDTRCDCCPRLWLCRPLTWVLIRFPEMPSNMWGGKIGRLMGTHQFTSEECRYQGGRWWIDMLSFRTAADLHSDTNWRQRVYDFVFVDQGTDDSDTPQQVQMNVIGRAHQHGSARIPKFTRHGKVKPRDPWGPFTAERDSCQRSTFEDYCTGTCWLCCENRCERFHMWVQCGHIFCSGCSAAMMQRSMPCPLCRKVSTTIVEAPRPPADPLL